jgi:Mrp family chromosome partitioning ATPase/capsular polysaccharide biosynthesis protein
VRSDDRSPAVTGDRMDLPGDGDWIDRPGVLASLSRYRGIVIAVTLLAALLGFGLASLLPVQYKAEAMLILRDPGAPSLVAGTSGSTTDADRATDVAKQADIATSTAVLSRALRIAGSDLTLQEARKAVQVQPSKDSTGITVDATAGDAAAARDLANAVGVAYQQVSNRATTHDARQAVAGIDQLINQLQQQLDASAQGPDGAQTPRQETLSGQIADLKQRQQDIATEMAINPSGVQLFEQAQLPDAPSQPKPVLFALLGAVLGAVGSGGWAWWAAARDQRVERPGDAAPVLGAPLLGELPPTGRPRRGADGAALPSETTNDAYHFVLASLEHELERVGGTAVVMTSVTPGDATTTTTLNLAIAAREEDRKVALIDANQRSRHLSELCGVGELESGRSEPEGPLDADEYFARLAVTHSGIVLPMPAGEEPGHTPRLFRPPAFRKALDSIGEQFDLVLIDTPALLTVSDSIPIARQADGVVLVVDRYVPLDALRTVRDRLGFVSTPLIGYVFAEPNGRDHGMRALARRWSALRRRPLRGGRKRRRMAEAVSRP